MGIISFMWCCITGVNNIQANGDLSLLTSTGEYALYGAANAQTQLYHNGIKKFETTSGGATVTGDLTVSGGDITLGGTGRIQGIDTVSASTDAANKNYVDTCIAAVPTGDITTVTAGPGLCGGGTSGAVTLCHCDTSSQASVNNSNGTIIQDITLDTYGHVTGIGSCDLDCRYYKQCDIYTQTCINTLLSGKLSTSGCAANSALLDSIDSSQFLRSDTADTASGTINFSGDICVGDQILHTGDSDTYLQFDGNAIWINHRAASENFFLATNRLFRDTSAWYHIVWQLDTTDGTAADRAKLYINGVRETSFQSSTYANMSQNYDAAVNNTVEHEIGKYSFIND